MSQEEENKKRFFITFNLSMERQKTAYEVLMKEKNKTGLSPSFIIHEALEVYEQYLQQKTKMYLSNKSSVLFNLDNTKMDVVPSKVQKHNTTDTVVTEKPLHPVLQEQESILQEEDIDIHDPYLMGIIGQSYPEED